MGKVLKYNPKAMARHSKNADEGRDLQKVTSDLEYYNTANLPFSCLPSFAVFVPLAVRATTNTWLTLSLSNQWDTEVGGAPTKVQYVYLTESAKLNRNLLSGGVYCALCAHVEKA